MKHQSGRSPKTIETAVTDCLATVLNYRIIQALPKVKNSSQFGYQMFGFFLTIVNTYVTDLMKNEVQTYLHKCTYRVFKFQVYFLKVVQLGAPWTNLHKLFFSDFLKMVNFCQVTKKKDFYSITAATIAEC